MENTLTVHRINPVTGYGSLKAFADITVNGVKISGVRLVEGKKGRFVSMPQKAGTQGRYFPICSIEDTEVRTDLLNLLNDELSAHESAKS